MGELQAASESASPFIALLWVFYPMAALVLIELILRAINDDDDDQDGGKGIRIRQQEMVPVPVPSGTWRNLLIGIIIIGDLLNVGTDV